MGLQVFMFGVVEVVRCYGDSCGALCSFVVRATTITIGRLALEVNVVVGPMRVSKAKQL